MWRNFMKVMVTIAAIGVVYEAFSLGQSIGSSVDEETGIRVFWGILLGGFTLIGTTGMIVEGVGYLKIIAQAVSNGNQNVYMQSQRVGNSGYTYAQPTQADNGNYAYTQSIHQERTPVAVSNAKGKSILEAMQEENREQAYFEAAEEKNGWICYQCGERNEEGNVYCKYCGTHK